jgi:hypothetical protein
VRITGERALHGWDLNTLWFRLLLPSVIWDIYCMPCYHTIHFELSAIEEGRKGSGVQISKAGSVNTVNLHRVYLQSHLHLGISAWNHTKTITHGGSVLSFPVQCGINHTRSTNASIPPSSLPRLHKHIGHSTDSPPTATAQLDFR